MSDSGHLQRGCASGDDSIVALLAKSDSPSIHDIPFKTSPEVKDAFCAGYRLAREEIRMASRREPDMKPQIDPEMWAVQAMSGEGCGEALSLSPETSRRLRKSIEACVRGACRDAEAAGRAAEAKAAHHGYFECVECGVLTKHPLPQSEDPESPTICHHCVNREAP